MCACALRACASQDRIKHRFHFLHVACIGFFRMPWSCLPSRPPSQAGVSGLSCTAVALLSPDRSRASLSSGSSRASTKDVELETPEKPRRKVGRPTGTFGSHALRRRMAEQQDEKKSQALLQEPKAVFSLLETLPTRSGKERLQQGAML